MQIFQNIFIDDCISGWPTFHFRNAEFSQQLNLNFVNKIQYCNYIYINFLSCRFASLPSKGLLTNSVTTSDNVTKYLNLVTTSDNITKHLDSLSSDDTAYQASRLKIRGRMMLPSSSREEGWLRNGTASFWRTKRTSIVKWRVVKQWSDIKMSFSTGGIFWNILGRAFGESFLCSALFRNTRWFWRNHSTILIEGPCICTLGDGQAKSLSRGRSKGRKQLISMEDQINQKDKKVN